MAFCRYGYSDQHQDRLHFAIQIYLELISKFFVMVNATMILFMGYTASLVPSSH